MNYSTRSARPTAHIAVSNNRVSHRKVGNTRFVSFADSTEFQIELTNYHTETVLAKIKVNGKSIGSSGLVLRPGEHIYLDRFLDDPQKFLFDIYEVDDVPAAHAATQNNGLVEVEFYREYIPPTITYTGTTSTVYYPDNWNWVGDGATSMYINSGVSRGVNSILMSNTSTRGLLTDASSVADPQMETGRVEKGGQSSQQFQHVNKQFESMTFHTETIKIVPASRDTTQHIKVYCPDCGRRFRKTDKFCCQCGCRK